MSENPHDQCERETLHTDDLIALIDSEEEGIEQGVLYLEGGQTSRTIRLASGRDVARERIIITLPEVYEMAGRRELSILHAKDLIDSVQSRIDALVVKLLED